VTVRGKEFRFAVELTTSGELRQEQGVSIDVPPGWSPEHLLLAALVRCSIKSLRYHARRKAVEVRSTSGSGRTLVAKRDSDDRYALVEAELELSVELAPEPQPEALTELLALAERDCFVGTSLTAEPNYRWIVNGRTIGS
jgi:uncharacterized OsmC-like protein